MRKKRIIPALALLLAGIATNASAAMTGVKVTDGNESVTFSFESLPTVNFGTETLIVASEETTVEFPITSQVNFEFVDDTNSIKGTYSDNTRLSFSYNGIEMQGFKPESQVTVYDLNGIALFSSTTSEEGYCFIPAENLPKGYLIINTSNKTFKILK